MLIGFMAGLFIKPKDKDLKEQQEIYDKKIIQYEIDLAYYKELCKWHTRRYEQATKLGTAYAIRMGVAEGHTTTAISDAIRDLKGE